MFGRKKNAVRPLFGLMVLALVAGFAGGLLAGLVSQDTEDCIKPFSVENTFLSATTVSDAANKVGPTVVSVVASRDLPFYRESVMDFTDPYFEGMFLGENQSDRDKDISSGSGFIVSSDGLILTNYHVVDDADASFSVILSSGEIYDVTAIRSDPLRDLALLTIEDETDGRPTGLPTATIAPSSHLKVGQPVVAIGNALAAYSNTVTAGIISALSRSIAADSIDGNSGLAGLIQTDASIHAGNSGGPLVDLEGHVIGITTAVARDIPGIGFAIPSDDFASLLEEIPER